MATDRADGTDGDRGAGEESRAPAGRVESDAFYATPPALPASRDAVIPERAFYGEAARPPAPEGFFTRMAQRTAAFGLVLFGLGWLGILIQAGFFQQVVVGAPLFEEPAKIGGPLMLVGLLRLRALWVRLPLALAFGAGFGVMEHYVTYAEEDVVTYASRVSFHALSTGLNMASFHALEPAADVRLRWATTAAATLLHAANNFAAVVLAVASLVVGFAELVASVWTWGVTGTVLAVTVAILARPGAFRRLVASAARRFVPAMRAPPA